MAERPDPSRTLYLIDGSNNLYRAFHALPGLTNRKGLPTNAVYGFTTMLRKLMKDFSPRYLAVLFDTADRTFRHEEFDQYKAHRPETPDALVVQIPWVKRVLEALRVPSLELPGWEADDLIGTLAKRAAAEGMSVVIVATDKDLLQLVGDGVLYFNPSREAFLDAAGVEQIFGVRPEQVPDVLALWGDPSDNIPGVPGIGDKGAKDLIRRFGDLETLLSQADKVESRRYREPLLSHAEDARLSRRLALIRCDAPIDAPPAALQVRPPDVEATRALFTELEFTALLRDLPASQTVLSLDTPVLEAGAVRPLVEGLRGEPSVALALVREGAQAATASLVGIAVAAEAGTAGYLPVRHRGLGAPRPLDAAEAARRFLPLIAGEGPRLIGHDVKPDLMLLRRLGLEPRAYAFDTMLASYLLNPERRSHALDRVAQEIAGLEVPSWSQALGEGVRALPVGDLDAARAAAIAGTRAGAVARLEAPMRRALEEDGLLNLLEELELPLMSVLAEMEACGVRIDVPFLQRLSAEWETALVDLTRRIHALAGREFNINSSRQLGEILFQTLKLVPGRKTRKTGSFSTDSEVLEELAADHELPRQLLEYRALQKLKSTYLDALPALVDPGTGRVHTSLNQAVAATGRLSSSDPNLQNIPIRTERGRQIRRAFVPEEGWTLLSADYSQIELRVLAHMCGDPVLIEGFRAGEDVHKRTAAALFGVMPPLVTGEMRRRAKAVNFGIIYGMGPQRLARDQGVTHKEAEAFIREYFERFPKVKAYIDATIAAAERDGRVRTLFGRLRYFPDLRGGDRVARMQALRAAVNTTIQGTAADLIKKAMVDLARRLRREGCRARMVLQVHDELVLEAPAAEAADVAGLVREVMEGTHPLDVPLSVDVRRGANWLDLLDEQGRSKD